MNLNEVLNNYLKENLMTITQFSRKFEIPRSTVGDWTRGGLISKKHIEKLREIFEVEDANNETECAKVQETEAPVQPRVNPSTVFMAKAIKSFGKNLLDFVKNSDEAQREEVRSLVGNDDMEMLYDSLCGIYNEKGYQQMIKNIQKLGGN